MISKNTLLHLSFNKINNVKQDNKNNINQMDYIIHLEINGYLLLLII